MSQFLFKILTKPCIRHSIPKYTFYHIKQLNTRSVQFRVQFSKKITKSNKINEIKCFNSTSPHVNETPINTITEATAKQQSLNIFKRFKEAYKQHGKILIWCHVATCCGWFAGFFLLSKGYYKIFYNIFYIIIKINKL